MDNFQKTLIEAYYYIIIADGMLDPKELSFGNLMIEKENIERSEFEDELDELANTNVDIIKKQLRDHLSELPKEQQLKIVAYMVKIADADGSKDPSELTSIQKIIEGFELHINDIIKMKQQLI